MVAFSNKRRKLLSGTLALGLGFGLGRKMLSESWAREESDRILVVLELSGGNDGLNTVIPYGDDAYFRARPRIGIRKDNVLKLDEHFGFNPGLRGLHRLWTENKLAIVHGCGYEQPSYSHFNSIAYCVSIRVTRRHLAP